MADRIGAVIVFKKDITPARAVHALNAIKEFIDVDHMIGENDYEKTLRSINKFDDELGGPVWYLP